MSALGARHRTSGRCWRHRYGWRSRRQRRFRWRHINTQYSSPEPRLVDAQSRVAPAVRLLVQNHQRDHGEYYYIFTATTTDKFSWRKSHNENFLSSFNNAFYSRFLVLCGSSQFFETLPGFKNFRQSAPRRRRDSNLHRNWSQLFPVGGPPETQEKRLSWAATWRDAVMWCVRRIDRHETSCALRCTDPVTRLPGRSISQRGTRRAARRTGPGRPSRWTDSIPVNHYGQSAHWRDRKRRGKTDQERWGGADRSCYVLHMIRLLSSDRNNAVLFVSQAAVAVAFLAIW